MPASPKHLRVIEDIYSADALYSLDLWNFSGYFIITARGANQEHLLVWAKKWMKSLSAFIKAANAINPQWTDQVLLPSSNYLPTYLEDLYGSTWQKMVANYIPIQGFKQTWYIHRQPVKIGKP